MPWIQMNASYAGGNRFVVTVRFRWWHPSFWRWLRDQVEVSPRFLTWPIVAWLVFTFARNVRQ